MDNKIMLIDDDKVLVEDRLELNFKNNINYFKASVKGVVSTIINGDTNNIKILKNNEEIEINGEPISKIEFIRDCESCIFAKVKYCTSKKNSVL